MKKVILTTALMLCIIAVSFAQKSAKDAKKLNIKSFGNDMCQCMDKVFGKLHPAIKQMFIDIVEVGEDQAKTKLEKYIMEKPNEKGAIEKSIESIEDVEKEMDAKCPEMKKKYQGLDMTNEDKAKVIEYLEKKKGCKMAAAIMKSK
ncbi:MAG: hypothetical protein EAZ85_07795 [Bacteroidetes bacterium]|nr:MAG: hypothetical protein EAZ85_07795 [Bacteroidota bacterium]TAG92756.1 MAG: hypothetical protein EAZ20_02260 [Bacteroidota bacterium]